ncbi:MAG: hypothetical protein K2X93_03285 [Candidatus Obscuribacterales bacterium]|nr:hypothetical protein [Candidatus Obscuribacterales bacterium]
MLYHHPPSEELRQTFQDLNVRSTASAKAIHQQKCACCHTKAPDRNHRELKFLAIVVFAITLMLVALNAYQRDIRAQNDLSLDSDLGPGATKAAESSFPQKTPTLNGPIVYVPVATASPAVVRPSEPALQYIAVPFETSRVRLKHVVGR